MSRSTKRYDHVIIARGKDDVLGEFVQIADMRFASTPQDYQGEGYVLDYDELGWTLNRIGATIQDLSSDEKLVSLTNAWWRKNHEAHLEDEPVALVESNIAQAFEEEQIEADFLDEYGNHIGL